MNSTIAVTKGSDGWRSMFPNIVLVIEGLAIGIPNFVVALAILRYCALRKSKEYLIVMGLSTADGLRMMTFFSAGLYRIILIISGRYSQLKSPWDCATLPHNILSSFATPMCNLMLLVISIDRLFAVALPLKYITWTWKYACAMIGAASTYSFITGTVMYVGVVYSTIDVAAKSNIMLHAKCSNSQPLIVPTQLSMLYQSYALVVASVFMFASIVVYIPVWLILRKGSGKVDADSNHSQNQKQKLAQQRRVTTSLGISCLFTVFLGMIPYTIGRLTIGIMPESIRFLLFLLGNLNQLCNVFIYALRHHEMKEAIKGFFTGKQMPDTLTAWQANRSAKNKQTRNTAVRKKQTIQVL